MSDISKAYPIHKTVETPEGPVEIYLNKEIPLEEMYAYVARGQYDLHYSKYLKGLYLNIDGDYVDVEYETSPMPGFDRIRRITGYLVGTLDRFNDGKRAEEAERVKHHVR